MQSRTCFGLFLRSFFDLLQSILSGNRLRFFSDFFPNFGFILTIKRIEDFFLFCHLKNVFHQRYLIISYARCTNALGFPGHLLSSPAGRLNFRIPRLIQFEERILFHRSRLSNKDICTLYHQGCIARQCLNFFLWSVQCLSVIFLLAYTTEPSLLGYNRYQTPRYSYSMIEGQSVIKKGELINPRESKELGYYAGFCGENSMGFGFEG